MKYLKLFEDFRKKGEMANNILDWIAVNPGHSESEIKAGLVKDKKVQDTFTSSEGKMFGENLRKLTADNKIYREQGKSTSGRTSFLYYINIDLRGRKLKKFGI